jgi:uncharacterized protein YecE (DUF72 family)
LRDEGDLQASLFEEQALGPVRDKGGRRSISPVEPSTEARALAERLPPSIRLGGMSWSYPGWAGSVYAGPASTRELARHGLPAYAAHPLLRTVEIDRSYYDPLTADAFRAYAAQVPDHFRFVVKAHEDCVVERFPTHARYGQRKGLTNTRFLDGAYGAGSVVPPIIEGLGSKLGLILFQFPPQDGGGAGPFARRLGAFLRRLPRGPVYAVELRTAALLSPDYGDALVEAGAVHCHNVWTAMPAPAQQARLLPPATRRPLILRWLLRWGDPYDSAQARFEPFDRLREEDPGNRAGVASLVTRAHRHGVPALVTLDNKAEGCAPLSVFRLARAIVDGIDGAEAALPRA